MFKPRAIRIFILSLFCLSFAASYSYGAVPQLINYHGTLTDKNGTPVPDGQYAVVFSIYDVPTDGTALWTETWSDSSTSSVTVTGGSFNALLGKFTPIPASFFSDHPITYLGVKVGNDSEMAPRQQIVSVGYSFTAGNGVPKGGIIMWSGAVDQIPSGWALCDGSNGTPNLTDRFIVGAGASYEVGEKGGEKKHTLTIAEMPSHTHIQNPHSHTLTDPGHTHTFPKGGSAPNADALYYAGDDDAHPGTNAMSRSYTGISINSTTATNQNTGGDQPHNNMPPYYALAYIMKL